MSNLERIVGFKIVAPDLKQARAVRFEGEPSLVRRHLRTLIHLSGRNYLLRLLGMTV